LRFKWLSEIKRDSKLFREILGQLVDVAKNLPHGWTREKILDHFEHHDYDCFVGFEGRKIAGWWAVNKDRKENVMKGFMVYVPEQFRHGGRAARLTAELARRAQAGGFKFAQLGQGRAATAKVLASAHRQRRELGVNGFNFNGETGKVTFPRRRL